MWFYLALLSAFFNSLSEIARRTHGSLADPAELSWWTMVLSLPLSFGLVLTQQHQAVHITPGFAAAILVSAALGVYGGVAHFKAFKYGEASAVSPIANLLPIALLVTSFFILGTVPSWKGIIGVLLVVSGVYYSSVSGKHSLLLPFRNLVRNKGSRAMLVWVAANAVAAAITKIALGSAAAAYVMFVMVVSQIAMLSVYLLLRPHVHKHKVRRGERILKRWGWHIAAIAVFGTLAVFFQYQAMKLADVSYVLTVKRMDVLMTVLLAGLFLGERHILRRFKGSLIAVAGVAIIFLAT